MVLNTISIKPIVRRVHTNGNIMFAMLHDLHIHVNVPDFPDRDRPEMTDAFVFGARVVDSFVFTADVPSEYIFCTKKEYVDCFDRGIEDDPNDISFIAPYYDDLDETQWPLEFGDYKLIQRIDLEYQDGDDPSFDIFPLMEDQRFEDLLDEIKEYLFHGRPLEDILMLRVWPNGSAVPIAATMDDQGHVVLSNPEPNKLYSVNIYCNTRLINLIREGRAMEYHGTIQKLPTDG